jgi:hypothetical protein
VTVSADSFTSTTAPQREANPVLTPFRADDGAEYDGAATIVVDAPLARLPWFERVRT